MQYHSKDKVDFLCAGAQRSGTSWLWAHLRARPDIWFPPNKEIHYFTRATNYPTPSHLACRGLVQKFLGNSQECRTWRWLFFGYAHKSLARAAPDQKLQCLLWLLKYFFGTPCDEWYLSLFRRGSGKICGEITPDYSLLDECGVENVVRLLPNIKILLLMRDPLDRVLSQTRYHMDGKAYPDLSRASEDELVQFATQPGQVLRGDYGRILAIWRKFIPAERIYLGYYEDIQNRPGDTLNSILDFLGAETIASVDGKQLAGRRNAASPRTFSGSFVRRIAPAHEGAIRGCVNALGEPAALWLERFKKLMDS